METIVCVPFAIKFETSNNQIYFKLCESRFKVSNSQIFYEPISEIYCASWIHIFNELVSSVITRTKEKDIKEKYVDNIKTFIFKKSNARKEMFLTGTLAIEIFPQRHNQMFFRILQMCYENAKYIPISKMYCASWLEDLHTLFKRSMSRLEQNDIKQEVIKCFGDVTTYHIKSVSNI